MHTPQKLVISIFKLLSTENTKKEVKGLTPWQLLCTVKPKCGEVHYKNKDDDECKSKDDKIPTLGVKSMFGYHWQSHPMKLC